MIEFKGTKGKWDTMYDFSKGWDNRKLFIVNDDSYDLKVICKIKTHKKNEDIENANALLISKAPEMLEILQEINDLINNVDYFDELSYKIEKLIKQATEL